jgi:hypothetical protein
MKKIMIAVSAGLALASVAQDEWNVRDWPALLRVSTNVNSMVLSLEFSDVSVVAGERLRGKMVVSNATDSLRHIAWKGNGVPNGDTKIGQLVVQDDERNPVLRTVWEPPVGDWIGGREGEDIEPGHSAHFPCDIVKNYSLTNPGIYLVKAVATVGKPGKQEALAVPEGSPVKITRPLEGAEEMIIETPIVLVTVTPRPATMPSPQPLHTPNEIENILKDRTPLFVMTATHPKPERPANVPRVAPREVMAAPLPQGVQDQSVSGAAPAKKETPMVPSRGILLGLIAVLLSGGLVIYLVWSRRKHSHP